MCAIFQKWQAGPNNDRLDLAFQEGESSKKSRKEDLLLLVV